MKNILKIQLIVMGITIIMFITACSQTQEPLTIGFWNVENLFDLTDDPNTRDEEFALGGKKNVTPDIYNLKLKNTAKVLTDLNADIVGLCEVENRFVLKELLKNYSGRPYNIIHFDSPDSRGIDNALLYDETKIKLINAKAITNELPHKGKTRDILYVMGQYRGIPLHIFVNHWPSNYGGKKQALPKRAATAGLVVKEMIKILSENPAAEIILLGDFNEDPDDEHVQSLRSVGLTSLMMPLIGEEGVGTYVYRGKDYFYDQIIVSEGLLDNKGLAVLDSTLLILDKPEYRQQEGKFTHYPYRFWAGDRLLGGYSDHLAIKVGIVKK